MFCCTKRQDHFGEIVNSICLEQECIKSKNQLSCPVCIQEEHQGHLLTTMKKILPELLTSNKEKDKHALTLKSLLAFVTSNFGEEDSHGQDINLENVVNRAIEVMIELKSQVESNNQEIYKMKDIFKNLNKNANQSTLPISKSSITTNQYRGQEKFSPQKQVSQTSPSKLLKSNNFGSTVKSSQINVFQSSGGSIDTFSHSLKHPYLSLSSNQHTVTKSSHPGTNKFISGHRYSVLSSKSLSPNDNQVHVKIDSSPSGNIMIGLCHQSIVKDKDFVNSYGINHGTYLIGQNGNSPDTAISFHHTSNIFNRKQIVGWNFKQGDVVTVGFNFKEDFVYFKLHKEKGKVLQFGMALISQDCANKQQIYKLVNEYGLRIIVLLQNIGDQVTLMEA